MASGENPPQRGLPRPLSGGPVKFGPYILESRLAVGGTAEVYIARPQDPKAQPRRLIVKRLLPHFVADPEGRTMFEREAALHAAVLSDNVVKVFASGATRDEPWLAMELVDGCDLYRLLRRLGGEGRKPSPAVAVCIARQVLCALESVHGARDPSTGQPMGIIHRDVTPSNVLLAVDGGIKLGDFGIARSTGRATLRSTGSAMLKGKFAYLAPEQVAGEPFDHRADLFSLAVVLSEMLIGRPLFDGSGQLAVLLAIRDCRIDGLRDAKEELPPGLYQVLERALSRDPAHRLATASALSAALAPFEPDARATRAELGALVRWVQSAPSAGDIRAIRGGAGSIRAARRGSSGEEDLAHTPAPTTPAERASDFERATGEYAPIPSFVLTQAGERKGPWPFARLVEAIATGEVGRGDRVEYVGRDPEPIETIDDLARFLPTLTATTNRLAGVGAPDFADDVSTAALVAVLLRVFEDDATGVLFAEGPNEPRPSQRGAALGQGEGGRKELYFVDGRLHHVSSNNASELLGEYLVRRATISREELDFALAVLPRYGGRMGDTLVSLGLVGSLEVFGAIRDQGRDRLIDLFRWPSGRLAFYAEQTPPRVQFALDLELPALVVAGVEAAEPGDAPLEAWRAKLDTMVRPAQTLRPKLLDAPWPPLVRRLLDATAEPRSVRDVLTEMARDAGPRAAASDVLRALEVLLAAKLLACS